ncbi:hypothetical protein KC335_g126 [Hortaea werneckii]|nr:hypothetical protein KC335_g126 [Hortaea werneckii]
MYRKAIVSQDPPEKVKPERSRNFFKISNVDDAQQCVNIGIDNFIANSRTHATSICLGALHNPASVKTRPQYKLQPYLWAKACDIDSQRLSRALSKQRLKARSRCVTRASASIMFPKLRQICPSTADFKRSPRVKFSGFRSSVNSQQLATCLPQCQDDIAHRHREDRLSCFVPQLVIQHSLRRPDFVREHHSLQSVGVKACGRRGQAGCRWVAFQMPCRLVQETSSPNPSQHCPTHILPYASNAINMPLRMQGRVGKDIGDGSMKG